MPPAAWKTEPAWRLVLLFVETRVEDGWAVGWGRIVIDREQSGWIRDI